MDSLTIDAESPDSITRDAYAIIEQIVDERVTISPHFLKLREDVTRLQTISYECELTLNQWTPAIKDLETTTDRLAKKIERKLKALEQVLGKVQDAQDEAVGLRLSDEMARVKVCDGTHTQPPETNTDLAQPFIVPSSSNTWWARDEGSSLTSQGLSLPASPLSPPASPLLPPGAPSPSLHETHVGITLPMSQKDTHDAISPSLPRDGPGTAGPTPDVTHRDDSTQVFPSQSVEPPKLYLDGTAGNGHIPLPFQFYFLILKHWVEAGNACIQVGLDYGRRCRRALLNKAFVLHPQIFRVYLIVESTILSLHTATLLLTCLLYIQEATQLATQTEPEIVA